MGGPLAGAGGPGRKLRGAGLLHRSGPAEKNLDVSQVSRTVGYWAV